MAEQEVAQGNPLESFLAYVRRAFDIVQLKTDAIDEIAGDEAAFSMGLAIIALGGVATSIGTFAPFGVIAYPVFFIVGAFIAAGIFHLIATLAFKAEGDFMTFFRPFSHGYLLFWAMIVPVLNFLVIWWAAWLWLLVVAVIDVEQVYKLDRPKAIATVAIPAAAMILVSVIFFTFLLGLLFLFGLRAA